MVDWWGEPCYICIVLSVKLFWCSGIPYIYGQLEGVHLPSVYVHSTMCKMYLVKWYSIDLWSVGGYLGICAFCYM